MADRNRVSFKTAFVVQAVFGLCFVAAWCVLPEYQQRRLAAQVQHKPPLADVTFRNRVPAVVTALYDDANVISDDELHMVLEKILPRFERDRLRPNYVEHALRTWGCRIEFDDPELMSGPQMTEFLLNTGQYVTSWGTGSSPLLEPIEDGVRVRWGTDGTASVHHDHMLASLAEAGIDLDRAVFTTRRQTIMEQILSEALRDFRLDERETEWSTLAFALYLAEQQTSSWHNSEGRRITFDMLADRLMRSHRNRGVCLGTHRVFSLMALLRSNENSGGTLIFPQTQSAVMRYLSDTRDLLVASQLPDGSWPPNWYDGENAAERRDPDEQIHRRVIATGHHLEWLAIAPLELHPPHNRILKAARWVIENTRDTPQRTIDANYTFYSHVGNALALWRRTTVAEFWESSAGKRGR